MVEPQAQDRLSNDQGTATTALRRRFGFAQRRQAAALQITPWSTPAAGGYGTKNNFDFVVDSDDACAVY